MIQILINRICVLNVVYSSNVPDLKGIHMLPIFRMQQNLGVL